MRTNIDIDDKLMKAAMKITGASTKKAVVEVALKRLVHGEKQRDGLRALRGIFKEPGSWIPAPDDKDKWEEAEKRYAAEDNAKRNRAA